MTELLYSTETQKILGAAIEVHKELGHGFLEPIYQEALEHEFRFQKIAYEKEKQLTIRYKDVVLNKYYVADFICFEKIIIELKAMSSLLPEHESQVLNYLHPV